MGYMDLVNNLRAVNNEASVINSNIVGVNRTAYKKTDYDYGGTGAHKINDSVQIPDNNLTTKNTSIDFKQGDIISTGEKTHFAINGDGFFLLQQIQDVGVNPPNLLSRDGQFKFSNIPALGGNVLTTNSGLVVLRDNGLGAFVPITQNDFDNNNFRPSVVNPDDGTDSMKFSKNGSTIFEFTGTVSPANGMLVQGSLETSNSNLSESMVALSLNKKRFEVMAAQLKVEQSNTDTILGIFK
ncbi:MAG: flagellar basal body rod C-terminal domain-containing protein [Candidatus Sericytochromatia bacterium]